MTTITGPAARFAAKADFAASVRPVVRSAAEPTPHGTAPTPVLDLVVPVHNEEQALEPGVRRLRRYLDDEFPVTARITIADIASTDATLAVANRLAKTMPGVRTVRVDAAGRGRALRESWNSSEATVVAWADLALAGGLGGPAALAALAPMVTALVSGHSELAVGSRRHRGDRTAAGTRHTFVSRSCDLLLGAMRAARFSDFTCGLIAVRADVARSLLPQVEDDESFFGTELLIRAERKGLRILQIPVDGPDDPGHRAGIRTAANDRRGVGHRLGRPAVVGAMSALVCLVLFGILSAWMSPQRASLIALLATVPALALRFIGVRVATVHVRRRRRV